MEEYIVSARKYRPTTFRSVVGQKSLTTTLKNAIQSGKLAHAYLFCGPRGVGKTTCARIFAKTINCLNITTDGEACNACESCRSFNEQRSLNIYELDAASNNSVDDIRQLTEQVRIPPQFGKYKVYIIDEVHMLSPSAFNAFLKTLEEPPHYVIFILATTEKQKILPTILSRCQTYDFSRITIGDMAEYMLYIASCENIATEPEALNIIAQKADGGMRDALSVFDQVVSFTGGNITYKAVIENLNVLDYEYYFRFTGAILSGDVRACLLILNEILGKGFDGQNIIIGLTNHFRDLLVCKDEATLVLFEVGASIRQRYREMSARCADTFLFKAIELCNRCDLDYRNSLNKRLLLELTLIQLCQLIVNPTEEEDKKKTLIKPITSSTTQESDEKTPASPSQNVQSVIEKPAPAHQPVTYPATATSYPRPKEPPILKSQQQTPTMPVSSFRTTSLKELSKVKTQAQTLSSTSNLKETKNDFSEADLTKYWIEYANRLNIDKVHLKNTLITCKPSLKEDFRLEVAVYNPSQKDEIAEHNSDILTYLTQKLNNTQINIDIRIVEKDEKEMIYTPSEKYAYLSKKNPTLDKFKELFDLSLE